MEVISLVSLVALMKKMVDSFKYVTNKNLNALLTQLVTWLTGIFVMWLASSSSITQNLSVFGMTFGELDFGSIVLGGMIFSSAASIVYDLNSARDNTDTAVTPSLVPAKKSLED